MKSAIYLRVSSDGQSTEMQRSDLERYCRAHGYDFDIFEEKISGRTDNRPELRRMMTMIAECYYGRVIVWKLDRFARSIRDLSNLLADLDVAKCTFVSFKEHLDLSTATGRMMIQLLGVFAEFELSQNKTRQAAGIALARAKGVKFGRPGKYVLPEQILIEKNKGYSMQEVAKRLKISKTRMYEILRGER